MKSVKVITLPNGKQMSLPAYVKAWRTLKTMDPTHEVAGFGHFPMKVSRVLDAMQRGLHDRINRHIPGYGEGRKWDQKWQIEVMQAAIELNEPRRAIHWLPTDLHKRMGHRLSDH